MNVWIIRTKPELTVQISERVLVILGSEKVEENFEEYRSKKPQKAFAQRVTTAERLSAGKTEKLIEASLFAERPPLRD